jgi:hypothetical protein
VENKALPHSPMIPSVQEAETSVFYFQIIANEISIDISSFIVKKQRVVYEINCMISKVPKS